VHEDFPSRLRGCIIDESVASFARRCGFSEGLIRAYLKGEKQPGMERLVKIADASGVTVDWLATGRGPRTRKDAINQADTHALDALSGHHARRWAKLIELVETAPTPEDAEALIDDLFARAREKAELADSARPSKP